MTVGIALRPFASHAGPNASALVISTDAAGGLRFDQHRSMALASCLHRILGVGKPRQHRDANAASLRTLLNHIETNSSPAVRKRVELGHTRLAGDRGEGFTVRERIARGTYVSASLLRQIDALCQQALTQENELAIDRFLDMDPSPEEPTPWRLSGKRRASSSCGFRRVLEQLAREGTMASEAEGTRIWAQPAADYGNTWAHLRNAMVPGPCADLSDDALEDQLAYCDRELHLPVKPTRSRLLEVFHDALDAVCSFFQSHDEHTSPQALCNLRDNRRDLIQEKRRREFLGLVRGFLRAEVAAHASSGSYVDDGTLARMCASYLSRPAIFRSFVKAYNRHQVAVLVHGDDCPSAIAALVRQCDTAIDPQQRGGINESDLVALAEGLESWAPDNDRFAMLAEDGSDKSYAISEICEAVAGALAGLVLPPPGPRPLKARMDELKTQPRELTSTDFVRAAFPVLRPWLEERHRGALARRAAEVEMERSYTDRMQGLIAVFPMLAPWAARTDLRPGCGAACGLLALDLVIPHILHPIVYAKRLQIQMEEAQSCENTVKRLEQSKEDIERSYHANAAPGSAQTRDCAPDIPQDRRKDRSKASGKEGARDPAREELQRQLHQIDLCIEEAQTTTLLRITAIGRQLERRLTRMVEHDGELWRACEALQDYAEIVGACAAGKGSPGRQPVPSTKKSLRDLERRIPLVLADLLAIAQAYGNLARPQFNVLVEALRSIQPRLWLERDGTSPGHGALVRRSTPKLALWQQVVAPLLTGKRGPLAAGITALAAQSGRQLARAMEGRH